VTTVYLKKQDSKVDSSTRSISMDSEIENLGLEEIDDSENNQVDICSLRQILENDLEAIILLLENPKRSGGCEILSHSLCQNNHLLKIVYAKSVAKKRVLEKCVHLFKNYKLIANDSLVNINSIKLQKLDPTTIVLKNIPAETDLDLIRLYCEYLVMNDNESNDVEDILSSKLFKDTFYVKFKMEYDLEKLNERVNRRTFCNRRLEMMQTFETNMILIKLDCDSHSLPCSIEYDFNEYPFKMINKCLVLTHGNKEIIANLIENNESSLLNKDFSIEYLHNHDILTRCELIETKKITAKQSVESVNSRLPTLVECVPENDHQSYIEEKDVARETGPAQDDLVKSLEEFYYQNRKYFISSFILLLIFVNLQMFLVIIFSIKNSSVESSDNLSDYAKARLDRMDGTRSSSAPSSYSFTSKSNFWYLFLSLVFK
jgi:hypothetical protein